MTKVGTGESGEKNAYTAGEEAARKALTSGGMTSCDFTLVFATVGFDQEELLRGVRTVTGNAPLAGCTGEGIITQSGPAGGIAFALSGPDRGNEKVGVMAFSSDTMRFHTFMATGLRENSEKTGAALGNAITKARVDKPRVLLAFPDGYAVNSKLFFSGLEKTWGGSLPVAGGMSGHNLAQSTLTWQYYNDQAFSDGVACVLLSGEVEMELGVNHGCLPVGTDKLITRAQGNIVQEIDGGPAWNFFKEYLVDGEDDLTPEIATFISLGEKLPEDLATDYDQYIIRAPYMKNPDGSMVFGAEIPEGARVRLMRRDEEKISLGSAALAQRLFAARSGRKPVAVLQFDCAARGRMFFGDRLQEKEIDVAQDVFGKDVPWLGVFCFGELAPIRGKNFYHNQTVAFCAFYQ